MPTAFITHPSCALHEMGDGHPERPARLGAIEDQLHAQGLYDFLVHRDAPLATDEQLLRVHPSEHIGRLRSIAPDRGHVRIDPDTLMCADSLEAALCAAGANVLAVELVMARVVKRAFCNVRPPGHHAERNRAMGFCFFNNVAVGAAHALANHGLERVAIIDFDVHFGNGTEEIFRGDRRVMMCSTYEYPLYPDLDPPSVDGHIVNCPLSPGSGGEEFRRAVTERWLPELEAFAPQLMFISAGFDAHALDPLANLRLNATDFEWVTDQLCTLANRHADGRVISTLEGGYDLTGLATGVAAHIRSLMHA
jgi:acetoin utilization deacetylase AcuC-like enzyme